MSLYTVLASFHLVFCNGTSRFCLQLRLLQQKPPEVSRVELWNLYRLGVWGLRVWGLGFVLSGVRVWGGLGSWIWDLGFEGGGSSGFEAQGVRGLRFGAKQFGVQGFWFRFRPRWMVPFWRPLYCVYRVVCGSVLWVHSVVHTASLLGS